MDLGRCTCADAEDRPPRGDVELDQINYSRTPIYVPFAAAIAQSIMLAVPRVYRNS